ncbi:hypothetical protein BE221DRAFT_61481 [Ostreococcus tauri]|uniref:Glycosyltransferase family 92 protein n=1 Tax=Ostreococcus tauri TaxID=70448 RepID=A0A1Y5I4E9_OSTTA|nr:hypothetical protein BE221DRAFT_61481 [Ostreococcus tauri]
MRGAARGRARSKRTHHVCLVIVPLSIVAVFIRSRFARVNRHSIGARGVAVASTVSRSTEGTLVEDWLNFHRLVGVDRFYIFLEGRATTRLPWSKHRREVRLFDDIDVKSHHAVSKLRNKSFLKPYVANASCGASALFVRQTLNLEMAIEAARRDGFRWLIHIDVDELLYPSSSPRFNIKDVLHDDVPSDCELVVFPNHEAVPEVATNSSKSPFSAITLFRRNHQMVDRSPYRTFLRLARRQNILPNYFLAYANGKSAARLSSRSLRPNGAHRFKASRGARECTVRSSILHFPFDGNEARARRRAERCDCSAEDVEKCSMLSFDRELAAEARSRVGFEDWYERRVIESDDARKNTLLAAGLYFRAHEPFLLLTKLEGLMDD